MHPRRISCLIFIGTGPIVNEEFSHYSGKRRDLMTSSSCSNRRCKPKPNFNLTRRYSSGTICYTITLRGMSYSHGSEHTPSIRREVRRNLIRKYFSARFISKNGDGILFNIFTFSFYKPHISPQSFQSIASPLFLSNFHHSFLICSFIHPSAIF